eukprot:sb/3467162/
MREAAGSALMCRITEGLVLDVLRHVGCKNTKACVVLPVATGMALTLSLLYLKQENPKSSVVLWLRIDQKTCIKAPQTAGCTVVVIEPVVKGDTIQTNVESLERELERYGEDVLAVISTTSCFSPRSPDRVVKVAELCKKYSRPHVINNAYGIQIPKYMAQINSASLQGRVDMYVQSLDKNFMVPVGGSIVAGFTSDVIKGVSQVYPGRGSSTPTLDLFITLLSMGRTGLVNLLDKRTEVFSYLKERLTDLAKERGERVLDTPQNLVSLGLTLTPSLYTVRLTLCKLQRLPLFRATASLSCCQNMCVI